MRKPLNKNYVLHLANADAEATTKELIIISVIGMGANVIAYEATEKTGKLHYVLKECFPENGAKRLSDGSLCWKSLEAEAGAKSRMKRAYEMQLALQNETMAENTNTHLVDIIYQGNNTLYTITDHRNATTYDQIKDSSLHETLITARSIAKAVKAYHDNGYLHLDIKPKNVMIMPETREMVLLLDFDSITRKDAIANSPLSYSPAYAAPEQIQGRISKICTATDIYAIGAIIFHRVFGRLPEHRDQSTFSDWDYSENPLFEKLSMKARRLSSELFRRTISASTKNRFQTLDDLIIALDLLVKESDPGKRFIIDNCPACLNTFIGREAELSEIHNKLHGDRPVFITGMKGIGKTELAKNYARRFRNEYDVIRFAEYPGSMAALVSSGELVSIENDSDEAITIESFTGLVDERTLLIIDNYRAEENTPADEKLFDKLASLKSKLLLTTYEKAQDFYEAAQVVELGELSQSEQYRLFVSEYGDALSDKDAAAVEKILSEIRGYTLLIPLVAKLLKNSSLGFSTVLDRIKEAGASSVPGKIRHKKDSTMYHASIADIVASVLNMSALSEDEHFVMRCLAMLDGIRIKRSTFVEWIGTQYDDAITDLIYNRWINVDGAGKYAGLAMHDVIRDVVKREATHPLDIAWIQKPIDDYIEEIAKCITSFRQDGMLRTYLHGQNHPYGYPPLMQTVNLLVRMDDVYAIRFSKQRQLLTILWHQIDAEENASMLINSIGRTMRWDLSCACNLAPDCDDLLCIVENGKSYATLSARGKSILHIERLFFALKTLCECDRYPSREEYEILSLCRTVKKQAELAISAIRDDENENAIFNVRYGIIYRACVIAVFSLGTYLFTTSYPQYSSAALKEYSEFVNQMADELKTDYPKLVESGVFGNSSFDGQLRYFNDCLEPGSRDRLLEEFNEYQKYDGMSKEMWEDYQKWESEIRPEDYAKNEEELIEDQVRLIRSEAYQFVWECRKLGYRFFSNREDPPEVEPSVLFDARTLSQAAQLLDAAKGKYGEADRLCGEHNGIESFSDTIERAEWFEAACIHAYCSKDHVAARQYYADYLRFYIVNLTREDKNAYNTLSYLGLAEACREVLSLNIQHWVERYYELKEREIGEKWQVVCKILDNAEMLGDEEVLKKYRAIKKKLEDTGFEFES